MTELARTGQVAPGAAEAWQRHLGREVDPDSLRAELIEGSLPQVFHDTAVRCAGQTALTVDDETIAYGDLDHLAARAGGWLQARGIGPEERVVLCGSNSLNFVVAYLGVLRAGGVVVPAGAGLTESELRHFVEDSGAAYALAQGGALARLQSISRSDTPLRSVVALEEEEAQDTPSVQQAISEGEPLEPGSTGSYDAAMLAYTSGTTGRPKGVPLTHANLLSSFRAAMWAWRWSADDILVHALPFSHQHGLSGVHITLLAGSRGVERERGNRLLFASAPHSRFFGALSRAGPQSVVAFGSGRSGTLWEHRERVERLQPVRRSSKVRHRGLSSSGHRTLHRRRGGALPFAGRRRRDSAAGPAGVLGLLGSSGCHQGQLLSRRVVPYRRRRAGRSGQRLSDHHGALQGVDHLGWVERVSTGGRARSGGPRGGGKGGGRGRPLGAVGGRSRRLCRSCWRTRRRVRRADGSRARTSQYL